MKFSGRLFNSAIRDTGITVSGEWSGDRLLLQADGMAEQVDAHELKLQASGFNNGHLQVSWSSSASEFALFLEKATDRSVFETEAPSAITAQLQKAVKQQKHTAARFRLSWMGLIAFLLLPFIGFGVFILKADSVATWIATHIPHEYETKIGDLTLAQVKAKTPLLESGPAVDVVRNIGERLTPQSRYRYRWFVADAPEINAFAAPGGVVVVYAGLIREADNAEELAGVLAHEIAHVELRHSLKGIIKNFGLRAFFALMLGDVSGTFAGSIVTQMTELKFSRDAERDADREGLQRLIASAISPHGMPRFFEKLAAKEGKGGDAFALVSTHPSSEERMAMLKREIDALPVRNYVDLGVDWNAIKKSLPSKK